jgi:hypothetical protein
MRKRILEFLTKHAQLFRFIYVFAICVILSYLIFLLFGKAFIEETTLFDTTEALRIEKGEIINQLIEGESGYLSEVRIQFGTYDRVNTGTIEVCILSESRELYSWKTDMSDLVNNAYHSFVLETPIEIHSDTNYILTITEEYEGDNAVAVYTSSGGCGLSIDDKEINDNTLCFQLVKNTKEVNGKWQILLFIGLVFFSTLVVILSIKLDFRLKN